MKPQLIFNSEYVTNILNLNSTFAIVLGLEYVAFAGFKFKLLSSWKHIKQAINYF